MHRALGLEATKIVAGFKQPDVKEQGWDREALWLSLGQIPSWLPCLLLQAHTVLLKTPERLLKTSCGGAALVTAHQELHFLWMPWRMG